MCNNLATQIKCQLMRPLVLGARRMRTLIKMKLPSGLPQIFAGLKIGAVGVMAGAITGEFLGGGKGFGELIRVAAHS